MSRIAIGNIAIVVVLVVVDQKQQVRIGPFSAASTDYRSVHHLRKNFCRDCDNALTGSSITVHKVEIPNNMNEFEGTVVEISSARLRSNFGYRLKLRLIIHLSSSSAQFSSTYIHRRSK